MRALRASEPNGVSGFESGRLKMDGLFVYWRVSVSIQIHAREIVLKTKISRRRFRKKTSATFTAVLLRSKLSYEGDCMHPMQISVSPFIGFFIVARGYTCSRPKPLHRSSIVMSLWLWLALFARKR